MTMPAKAAPPCTATLRVEKFAADTAANLHITDHGFHPLGVAAASLEYAVKTNSGAQERLKRRIAERFEEQLRRALKANARELRVSSELPEQLVVSGKLVRDERHTVQFDDEKEGETSSVTVATEAQLIVSDASGAVVAKIAVQLSGPSALEPVTDPKFDTPRDVWRAVEQLVRRRVRFKVLLAWAWSRDIRRGLRAADDGDWQTAIGHWTRATRSQSPTTRRAAHFDLFVAHELAGRLDQARRHLLASEQESPASVGSTSLSAGSDPEGERVLLPTQVQAHRWRLEQSEKAKTCGQLNPRQ
jgi:hypothetical protein